MPKFRVRGRETRVHTLFIDADSEADAMEKAAELDGSYSVSDMFDEWEVLDATEGDD